MKISLRTFCFILISVVCVFAVVMALYVQFGVKEPEPTNTLPNPIGMEEENKNLAEKFKTQFENRLDYQNSGVNTLGVTKKDGSKDIIYTVVETKRVVENRYDIDLKVPIINISNNTSVEQFNKKIQSLFVDKANDIMKNATQNTIYSIDYMAYVNTNILSLVIRSTLKEGNNPQRVIIQTYNYNLSTNEEISLNQILEIKGLNKANVENTIMAQVKLANEEAEVLKHLGYNVYTRDLNSNIYKLENTDNYILGPNNKLYLVYPYGNANFTDEMDVIVF
ncbi:MAG: hypothetical protein HFJ26_05285 [Clostridia bacterium]|nr:hypothetical protein [Clostridia bacterium]